MLFVVVMSMVMLMVRFILLCILSVCGSMSVGVVRVRMLVLVGVD